MAPTRRRNWSQRRNGEGKAERYINGCKVLLEAERIPDLVTKREGQLSELADELDHRADVMNQLAELNEEEKRQSNKTRLAKIKKQKKNLSSQKCRSNDAIDTVDFKAAIVEWMLKYWKKENENRQQKMEMAAMKCQFDQAKTELTTKKELIKVLERQVRFLKQQIFDDMPTVDEHQNEETVEEEPAGPVEEGREDDERRPLSAMEKLEDQSFYGPNDDQVQVDGNPVDEDSAATSTEAEGLSLEDTADMDAFYSSEQLDKLSGMSGGPEPDLRGGK